MLMKDSRTLAKGSPAKKLVDAKTVEDFYTKDKRTIDFWFAKMIKYSKENVINSCLHCGLDKKTAEEISSEVDTYVDNRMRMSEVRPLIFAILQRKNPAAAKKFFKCGEIYVRTSGQRFEEFKREKIASSLAKETRIQRQDADRIAFEVEKFIRASNLDYVSSPLLREMVNARLIENGLEDARSDYTRIGMPVFDITELINIGSNENANLQYNPETMHKLIADNVLKEYALMKAIPRHATDAHLHGLIHIHDLDYFVLRPFCLDAEEKVLIEDGATKLVKIGELADSILEKNSFLKDGNEISFSPGINVYAFNPVNYTVGKVPLTAVSRRKYNGRMLEIKTRFTKRKLKLTPDHILFVWENGIKEKKAGEIRKGDRLLLPKKIRVEKPVSEINLIEELIKNLPPEELKKIFVHNLSSYKEFLRGLCRQTQEKIYRKVSLACDPYKNPIPLSDFKVLYQNFGAPRRILKDITLLVPGSQNQIPAMLPFSDKLARLLGYFVSEGNYDVSEGSYNLVLTAFDKEMQEEMKACISEFSTYCTYNDEKKQFYFGGKLLYLIFRHVFRINAGARNKNIPAFLFDASEEIICEFLKGYLSGDGGINKSEKSLFRIQASTTSKTLAEGLAYLFSRTGILPSLSVYQNICSIGFGGKEQIKEFAEKINFIQSGRRKEVENYLKNIKNKGSGSKMDRHILEDLFFEEVSSVSETIPSSDYVYDLSVDSHHNFVSGTFGPVLVHNCFSHDLRFFLKKGYYADGQGIHTAAAGPAKHAEVAILHAAKILASAQTNFGGGQGFNWFNIFLAPFMRGFDFKKMKQMAQMFLFEMSQMYVARGGQVVFSSINLEPSVPKTLENIPAVLPGGLVNGDTYGSYEKEANQLFRAFIEVYTQGDAVGKPFNFPKCEIKVTTKDFEKHREEMEAVSALASKFGTPYYFVQQDYMPEYACYQSLPYDEKVFVVINDELRTVKIGEYVEGLMRKQGMEKGKGLEGEVEVSEGTDFAISFNPETLELEKRRIGKVMRHKTKENIFRFVLDTNRSVSATAKHKIHVLRGGAIREVRAEEIRKGDYLVGLKNLGLDFVFNDEVEFKTRKMKIDADFARLLGYFASEGYLHIANRKNRANKICFSFAQKPKVSGGAGNEVSVPHREEKEFIEDVEKILKETFGLNPKRDVSEKNNTITVYVHDKSLAELFASLKTGFDAHSKRVPEKLLSAPRGIISEFLLGLFRGDGYFKSADKRKIDLHLCNSELIEDVFALSLRIGIPMDMFDGRESFSLRLTSNKRINHFLECVPFAALPKTDGGLAREFDFYDRIPSQPFGITRDNLKAGYWNRAQIGKRITLDRLELDDNLISKFAESDLHLFKVKEIEEVKSEYVYDFVDVDKHHNFANANGIFSSNCCAYLMQLSDQNTQDDLYNGTTRGGALQVVTINLPRIAYEAEGNDAKLFELLRGRMNLAKDVLLVKQKIIKQRLQQGILPFLSQPIDEKGSPYLNVEGQSLEIGMVGLNEMLKVHTGKELHEGEDSWKFGLKVIKAMTDIAKEFSAETGARFVTSRTPAESCSYRLASIDLKEMNGKAAVQGDRAKKAVYYTNGNHVRPSADIPLFDRIRIESSFCPILMGGTMTHVWLGESNPDSAALTSLTERIVKKTLTGYYAYTKDLTVCKSCKFVAPNLLKACPHCSSKEVDWYSRITGYYQKVSGWNAGKLQELHDRRRYGISS